MQAWDEVAEGDMPPWFRVTAHRNAQLSPKDKAILREWARGESAANGD